MKTITGIILAGGQSSRMGSDKGLISFNGSLFIEHVIKALKPLVKNIIIVSNNPDYDTFGYKRVSDLINFPLMYSSANICNLYSLLNVPI